MEKSYLFLVPNWCCNRTAMRNSCTVNTKKIDIDDVFICVFTEELDTDLETDRLLGQQRTDDQGFFDDKVRINHFLNHFLY
jgi:hypothetical protein